VTGVGEPVDGNTPLDDDERDGLIPGHIRTKTELNQWEALNIAQAHQWLARRRSTSVLRVEFLRELHRRMFGRTWKWAGAFRKSEKNISPYHWTDVPRLLQDLIGDTEAQLAARTEAADSDEIAMRFHHRLVRIHPWPNGNGRHARLATDALLTQLRRPKFTWGGGRDLETAGDARVAYVASLRRADAGDFDPLRAFVRS
jgi:Fic-DOC domain mobile mystery protein B